MKAVFEMRIAIAIYEQQTAGKELDQDGVNVQIKFFIYL